MALGRRPAPIAPPAPSRGAGSLLNSGAYVFVDVKVPQTGFPPLAGWKPDVVIAKRGSHWVGGNMAGVP